MEQETKTKKTIIFNVEPRFHRAIKIRAGKRNMTMKQYILMGINMFLQHDEKYLPLGEKD